MTGYHGVHTVGQPMMALWAHITIFGLVPSLAQNLPSGITEHLVDGNLSSEL